MELSNARKLVVDYMGASGPFHPSDVGVVQRQSASSPAIRLPHLTESLPPACQMPLSSLTIYTSVPALLDDN
jgi:hypothetical protein